MKLKTFIKQLQKVQKEHGDIEVAIDGSYWAPDGDSDFRFISPRVSEVRGMGKSDENANIYRMYRTLVLNLYKLDIEQE